MDMETVKNTATSSLHKAGNLLCTLYEAGVAIEKKGAVDLVTEADKAAEAAVIETISRVFPHHGILAEESGAHSENAPFRWVIDPLDGTTNFAHGLPLFCTSIAFQAHGETLLGAVLNPITRELFLAEKGKGATRNGKAIGVSQTADLEESLLVTGFPYNRREVLDELMAKVKRCLGKAQGLRRLGSAALDLCYLASGRFDGFWEQNLKGWDTAAGVLIAREAGGTITDFQGGPYTPGDPTMLATNGPIHKEMMHLLATAHAE